MRAVRHIDLAAERTSPARVVESLAAVERHPVINFGGISLALQGRVSLFVRDRVDPRVRNGAFRNISGHQVAGNDLLSVLVKIQMLGRQVHFHIGVPVIAVPVCCSCSGKRGRPVDGLTGGQRGKDPVGLFLLVDLPPVITVSDRDILIPGGPERLRFVPGVVPGGEILHILFRLGSVHGYLITAFAEGEPVADH